MSVITLNHIPSNMKVYLGALKPKKANPKATDLPDISYALNGVKIEGQRVRAYNKTCGFAETERVAACYPFILSTPVLTSLALEDKFPFKVLGMVHLSNEITQLKPLSIGDSLDFTVRLGELKQEAKGKTVMFITEAKRNDELVWIGRSEMFFFGGGHGNKNSKKSDVLFNANLEEWSIPSNKGREYGAVSGDRNPIHLFPFTAKLFGFKRHIIHGMWTKARVEAALASQLPEAFTLKIEFKTPVFLPAKVRFTHEKTETGLHYEIRDHGGNKPHAKGKVTFL